MPDQPAPAATAAPYPPPSPAPGTWRRVALLFRPHRAAVLLVLVLAGAFAALNGAVPLLSQVVFDRALFGPGGPDLPLLAALAGIAAVIACAVGAVDLGQTWVSARVAQRLVRSLREEMFDRLQRMPVAFFTTTKGGEIQSRLAGDTTQVENAIKETLPEVLAGLLGLVVAAVAMVSLSPLLAGAAVVLAPAVLWVSARSGRALKSLSAVGQETRAELTSIAAERLSLGGVTLARVHGRRADEQARFATESRRLAGTQVRATMAAQLVLSVAHVFFVVTPYLAYLAAGLADDITPGTLVAFVVVQSRLYQPLGQMLRISTDLRSVEGAFARVFVYLDLRPETGLEAGTDTGPGTERGAGALSVREVGFGYGVSGERERMALRGVSLDIPAGSTALIVGASGSGKTTLGQLLAGLRRPTEGAVLLDGMAVRAPLPGRLCIVPQDPFLFQGSVADNLRYADPNASPDELIRVCRITRIHERIMAFPDGYDAHVGERGALFSGGERQRIALARALLADASVLVLDEATSALDPLTEAEVVQAVLTERASRTTVMITHRFGVLDCFDTVVALDRGRVAEQGAPRDLRAEPHGLYARMVRAQTGGAAS
ncbi:ABC transporter ATP-binding protein [Microtetraspora malaysiensis]|uniref:ABC transporter ATP-binding protein n=1 Tax=Microtetraspora malaysiensis TaxID=161358 RepID=UPI003D8D5CF9